MIQLEIKLENKVYLGKKEAQKPYDIIRNENYETEFKTFLLTFHLGAKEKDITSVCVFTGCDPAKKMSVLLLL